MTFCRGPLFDGAANDIENPRGFSHKKKSSWRAMFQEIVYDDSDLPCEIASSPFNWTILIHLPQRGMQIIDGGAIEFLRCGRR